MTTYKPKECRESNEFWMPFYEFRQHFGDVLISSCEEPTGVYVSEGGVVGGVDRRYQSCGGGRAPTVLLHKGGVGRPQLRADNVSAVTEACVDHTAAVAAEEEGGVANAKGATSIDVSVRKNHIEVAECGPLSKGNTLCTAESDYQNVMTIFARDSWPEVSELSARRRTAATSTPPIVRAALIPRAKDDLFLAQRASFVYRLLRYS